MNAKKIIVIIVVILLSISIALLPVIASFATEEDHGMDAHSPSMSVGGEDESSREDSDSEILEPIEKQSDDAMLTADAEEEELVIANKPTFFEAHKMQIIIGGSAFALIIILAILIATNRKSKVKKGDKHYHPKH